MTDKTALDVTYQEVESAAARITGIAHRTPILTSRTIDRRIQGQVYFKCENFQRSGSFKFRGAYNALAQLSPEQKEKGVITYSSGNHAQAIALSGQLLGISATIVMPSTAPDVKIRATRGYGAEVILYDPQQVKREELGQKLAKERNLLLIPPYDHPHVVAGQGTAVKELMEDVGELDILLVGCGGGGLLSGSAIAANSLSPHCKVIGVEPEKADDATRSFHTKILHYTNNPQTIADGAKTPCLGTITFPLILHYVSDMVTVSEDALRRTMGFLWERMKIVVEPTGVLAAAALLEGKVMAQDARIGVIISGGNVDLSQLESLLLF